MDRAIDVSVPRRVRQTIVAGFFSGVLIVSLLGVAVAVTGGGPALLVVAAVLWIALTAVWVGRVDGDRGEGTVWDPIPEWQYDGRFVDAGGLTRSEQEEALDDARD